jgi:hypothetical protein
MSEFERLSRTIPHQHGQFDGYDVTGTQYEYADGNTQWHVTACPIKRNQRREYMVRNGKFHKVRMDIFPNRSGETLIDTLGEVEGISEQERNAVFKAIAEWEKPEEP